MKKAFFITVLLIFILCGCTSSANLDSSQSSGTVSVIMPDAKTAETVNGYYIPPEDTGNIKYYANLITKKFHLASCRYASSAKEENIMITTDRSRLLKDGFTPCKICKS